MAATSAQIEQVLDITGAYSLITGGATLTDNSAWGSIGVASPDTVKILLKIFDSTGDEFYVNAGWDSADFTSPNLTLGTTTYSFTLPVDVAGDYLQGQYLIQAKVQVVEGSDITVVTKNFYQNICATCNNITVDVQGSVNIGTTQVTLTDNTNYKTYTALSRTLILYPPAQSGQPSQTGNNVDVIVYSGTSYTGSWGWKLTADVTFTDNEGTSTTCRITGQGNFMVEQSQLCKVLCLLKKYRTEFWQQKSTKNVAQLQENYLLAMAEYDFAVNAYRCGNSQTVIDAYIQKIYSITGIDPNCDCGCNDGTSQPLVSITSIDGTDGTDGSSFLQGVGAPNNGDGEVGDSYLNSSNGDLYLKTGATTWTYTGSLKGATGSTGATGAAGAAGADGVAVLDNAFPAASTTTASAWETLDTYTLPAAKLSSDGSEIVISATYTTGSWTSATQNTRITFNGNSLVLGGYAGFYATNIFKVTYSLKITRTSNTTANYMLTLTYSSPSGAVLNSNVAAIGGLAGLNFTTTAYDIDADAYSAVIGDITLAAFKTVYYKK